jgi:hypothetical protein
MNKPTPDIDWFNNFNHYIGTLLLDVSCIGLLLAWGVEILVKTLFSLS